MVSNTCGLSKIHFDLGFSRFFSGDVIKETLDFLRFSGRRL